MLQGFTGKMRENRMKVANDYVINREQAVQQAREAREERERQQKRRKATATILRALLMWHARRTLQSLAINRIRFLHHTQGDTTILSQMLAAAAFVPWSRRKAVGQCLESLVESLLDSFCATLPEEVTLLTSSPVSEAGLRRVLEVTVLQECQYPRRTSRSVEHEERDEVHNVEAQQITLWEHVRLCVISSREAETWLEFLIGLIKREMNSSSRTLKSPAASSSSSLDSLPSDSTSTFVARMLFQVLATLPRLPKENVIRELLLMPVFETATRVSGDHSKSLFPAVWRHSLLHYFLTGDENSLPTPTTTTQEDQNEEMHQEGVAVSSAANNDDSDVGAILRAASASSSKNLTLPLDNCGHVLLCLCRLLRLTRFIGSSNAVEFVDVCRPLLEVVGRGLQNNDLTCTEFVQSTHVATLYVRQTGIRLLTTITDDQSYAAVASLLATPLTLITLYGDDIERCAIIPFLSAITFEKSLMDLLENRFLSRNSWMNSEVPAFSVRRNSAGVPMLFLHSFSYFVDSGSFALRLESDHEASEDRARQLVRCLRELAVRAHLYGCDTYESEILATRCCILLTRLFAIDETKGFAGSKDWHGSVAFNTQSVTDLWQETLAEDEDDEAAATAMGNGRAAQVAARRAVLRHQARRNYFNGSRNWDNNHRLVAMLRNVPFTVPFDTRCKVFSSILHHNSEPERYSRGEPFVVTRGHVFTDAFQKFGRGPLSALRQRLAPRFRSDETAGGLEEAGFGDGVYRDFILSLCKEGFSPEYGLFCRSDDGQIYPNPLSYEAQGQDDSHLRKFAFLGAIVGKALFDGILLDLPFAMHFRNALLGRMNTLDHLSKVDPQLFQNLSRIRDMPGDEVEALDLVFTANRDVFGVSREVELVPNGRLIPVTRSNAALYVLHYADYRLNREAYAQAKAFQEGVHAIVESTALQIFGSNELDLLFQGSEDEIGFDVDDWERNTDIHGEEGKDEPVIKFFWRVVRSMTPQEQKDLLGFVTSTKRAPLLGFQHMVPKFTIVVTRSPPEFLPSAATCFCQLKLPKYRSEEETRAKLITAISHGKTFELS